MHHSRLFSKLGVVTLTASSLVFAAGGSASFHGDATRSGVYASEPLLRLKGVSWTFKTGGPVVASPAVAGGVVYVASLSGFLYAIDQQSGAEKWRFKSRTPIASSPAVADGSVYFVSSSGALGALDAATGQPRWVFVAEHEKKFEAKGLNGYSSPEQTIPDGWDVFTSSPAVVDGRVFFGGGDGGIYAVDAKTGVLQWKFATGDVVHASPAIANNTVYIGSWDGNFYALDAATGLQKWVYAAGRDPAIHNQQGFQSSAAVVDGTVYVGCRDAHVYAFDAATGRRKWDYPTSKSWVNSTPAVHDGLVYAATSDSSRVMALDARSGQLRFDFDAKAYVFSSPVVAGGVLYIGSHNGKLYALDAKRGTPIWEFQTEASKRDALQLLNADGSLKPDAFAPVFGDFQDMYIDLYRFISLGAVLSSPVVDGGRVYVTSTDGNVYALS